MGAVRGGGGQKNQFVFENCFRYSGQSPGNLMIFILENPGKVLEFSFPFSVGTLIIHDHCEANKKIKRMP